MPTQLRLAKDASSASVALGETIASPSPTHAEADALLQGTLVQEAHARTACLQALSGSEPPRPNKPEEFAVWNGRAKLPLATRHPGCRNIGMLVEARGAFCICLLHIRLPGA